MKFILTLFIFFCFFNFYAKASVWNKSFNAISSDIKLAERTKMKDLPLEIRLLELYAEQLALLIEKENEYKLKILDNKKYFKRFNYYKKQKATTLKNLNKLAIKLSGKVKDPEVKARIHYTLGLYNYDIIKTDIFEKNFLIANKYAKSLKLKRELKVKLADYYFNLKLYRKALPFYNEIIRLPKDEWFVKHLYNRSWCFLKLGKTEFALKQIIYSYSLSRSNIKSYISLGEQHLNSVLLFFAVNKKTNDGLRFLQNKKENTFKNLMLYLHYTFESGAKEDSKIVMQELDSIKLNSEQYTEYTLKKISIVRSIKNYRDLEETFDDIKNRYKAGKVSEKEVTQITPEIESFTGFLQEIIRSSNLLNSKQREAYLKMINNNFILLSEINPSKDIYYLWMRGETFLSIKRYKKALVHYKNAITLAKQNQKSGKRINRRELRKIFQSYFKTLEILEGKKAKGLYKSTVFGYEEFLSFFPSSKLAAEVYRRYLNIMIKSQSDSSQIALLLKHYKKFPKMLKQQQRFFRSIVNKHIKAKNINELLKLQRLLQNGFLMLGSDDLATVSTAVQTLNFAKYEQLENENEYEKAITGYDEIFMDIGNSLQVRKLSLQKILILYDKFNFNEVSTWLTKYISFLTLNKLKSEKDNLQYYIQKVCSSLNFISCERHIHEYLKMRKDINPIFYSFLFESMLLQGQFKKSYIFLIRNRRRLPKGVLDQLKLSLINSVALLEPKEMLQLMEMMYSNSLLKAEVQGLIKAYALNRYYSFDDLSVLRESKLPFLKQEYQIILKSQRMISFLARMPLPSLTQKEVTFEGFSKELLAASNQINKYLGRVDQYFNHGKPNLGFEVYDNATIYLNKVSTFFESYYPLSGNQDLQKAIKEELSKIALIYKTKAIEFQKRKEVLFQKLNDYSGSHKKFYLLNEEVPWRENFIIQTGT